MFSLLLPALLSAAAIPKEQEGHGHGGCHRHHHHHRPHYPSNSILNTGTRHPISCDSPYQTFKAEVDAGTYKFTFTKPYTWAFQSFIYEAKTQTQVLVWDCFCSGDSFVVFDNGDKIFETEGGNNDTHCTDFSQFPNQCLFAGLNEDSPFAYGIGLLEAGKHNITIGIKASPYNSGTGFISIASACAVNVPEPGKKTLAVVKDQIQWIPCCAYVSDCNWSTILEPEALCHEPEKPQGGCHRHPRAGLAAEETPEKKKQQ